MGKRSNFERMKHGHSRRGKRTTEYYIWAGLKKRCDNPNDKLYPYYGGRGITYDSRWKNFNLFFEDMGLKPLQGNYSLERVDNNLGYSKENCVWATKKEQSRNRKNNLIIRSNDKEQCLSAWCEELNLPYKKSWQRLKQGWNIKRTLGINGELCG